MQLNPDAGHVPLESHFHRSIVGKLTLFVAFLVVISTGIVGAVSYWHANRTLLIQTRQRLSMLAHARAKDLRESILWQQERVAQVASRTRLRELMAARENEGPSETLTADVRRILADAREIPDFRMLSIADRSGKVVASTEPNDIGKNYESSPAFVQGLEDRAFSLSANGSNEALAAAPLRAHDGKLLGVVLATIDISSIVLALQNRGDLGDTGEVLVGVYEGDQIRRLFSDSLLMTEKEMPSMTKALANQHGFNEVIDYRGVPVMAAYEPVNYGGWGLVAKIDQTEGYAPIHKLNQWLWMLLGIVFAVGVGGSYLLARQFTLPITRLARVATAVSAGNLDTRVEVRSRDELGLLSAAFNHMLGQLSETQRLLEQRVADRTRALAQSESELRNHTLMLSSILDGMGDGVVVCDREGKFLVFNPAAEEILGVGRVQLPPSGWSQHYQLYRPDGTTPFLSEELPLVRATRGESSDDVEIRVRRTDLPHDVWINVSGRPLFDEHGVPAGGIVVFGNITERKHAIEELRIQNERTRRIIESAHSAFVAMDSAGRIIEWNAQAEATFGWTLYEVLGRPAAEVVVPERFREAHRQGLETFLKTGQGPIIDRRIELAAVHRDGHEFPIEITVGALKVGDDYQFNAFLHDISRRKEAEDTLRQAMESAEAANRSKSLFLANMSHEIRTPMNAIIGMTGLVLDSKLEPDQREYLTMVQESADSLLRVIEDILDFSKIEAGKLHIDNHRFSLRESLGDAMKTLGFRAHGKNLELACHIRTDAPDWFIGDAGRLRQIIVNLVGNAIKFTEQGEVVLDVLCRDQTEFDAELEFRVTDTGVGIPREKLSAIFEAFEQADTSTTRRYGGTGLGLAISARLVELMGGQIRVDSEVGHGTTFAFTLRFDLAPPGAPPAKANTEQLRGMRVLIVDDNATNRRILEEMVDSWSMEPLVAAGGDEALRVLAEAKKTGRPVRLMLTDAHMPTMDGFELAERIQRDSDVAGAIIMMLTSGDRPEDIPRCQQLGIASYLIKPVKQSELFNAIAMVVGAELEREAAHARPLAVSRQLDILLVEDSVVNQKLALGLLGRQGHLVTVAKNGREALTVLELHQFDIILMDVQMPEMDGFEATAAIRRREQQSGEHVPIIAMTAHAMKGDRERCLAAGMDGYISKPIRPAELFSLLEQHAGAAPLASKDHDQPSSASMSESQQLPLDWAAALETVDGDQALLRELAEAFLEECPKLLAELRQGLASSDAKTVKRAAHTMKSSMRYFGAAKAFSYCAALESMGQRGAIQEARNSLEPLLEQIDRLTPLLRDFAANGDASKSEASE